MLWTLPAQAQRAARFDIPAQNLATALDSFARQANVQLLYPYPAASAHRSVTLRGEMPVRAALDRLLRGSGLEVARFGDRVITLRAVAVRKVRPAPSPRHPARPAPPPRPTAPSDEPLPEEIIVTGRAASTAMADTELSYAITRLDADALTRHGPLSTADLFKQIPGFWVESTGGEASNNVRSRGIPTDGYSSVALLEDGLPIQYDGGLGYLNTDQIHRLDATVARVEAVRGGPSAIFTPNAPGGSINFVTRTGLANPGYTLSATGGSFGYARIDGFAGMRLTPELGLSLGGFYRRADGLRDPGYTGDRGGQIRAGIDYDDGRARLSFNVKRLDDRVVLYLPIPLRLDDHGAVRGIPGFDPLRDTLAGPDNVSVPFKTTSGPRQFDLSQGTRSRITFYTLSGRYAFDAASALKVKARLRTGSTLRNGLFPVGRPLTGDDYLASVRSQLASAYPAMAAVQIRYADGAGAFQPASNGNGLVASANLLSVAMPMREFVIDTRLTHSFDRWGHHEFAAGVTHDDARLDFDRAMGTVLLDIRGQARRLDVVALDGSGNQIGALTDNGFTRYGSLFDNAVLRSSNLAFYLADEWKVAPRWRVDLGMRWEHIRIGGRMETAIPIGLGDSTTLADDAVLTGTGTFMPIHRRFSGWSGSAGVNFNPSRHTGIFARFTRIARLPSATEFTSAPNRADEAIVPIIMAEAGLILRHRSWNFSAVAFHTRFERLPFTDYRFDPQTNAYLNRTSIADTATLGLELAGHAELAGPLALDVQATLQDPRYRNFSYTELVSGQPVSRDATGNQLIRVPRVSLSITPSLRLFDGRLRMDMELVHHSRRFADIANSQRLPAFSLINLNANAKLTEHAMLTLHITNLTNSLGLTEGNPRMGAFDTGGTGSRYFFARPEFGRTARMVLSLAL